MTWKDGVIPFVLTLVSIACIALASIIINSILKEDLTDESIYIISGFILAFSLSGVIFGLAFTVMGCTKAESTVVVPHTTPNICIATTTALLYVGLTAVVLALSAVVIGHEEDVGYASYIFASCILALSTAALAVMLGLAIFKLVKYCQARDRSHEGVSAEASIPAAAASA